VYECDECHREFTRKHPANRQMHFCTRDCYQTSARSGIAHDHTVQAMTPEVIEHKTQTMLNLYGVKSFASFPEVQAKARATNIQRYGSPSSMGDPDVRAKKEATFLVKYGTTVPVAYNADVTSRVVRALSNAERVTHWKTGTELLTRASYELAFVKWCNQHQIDFDWQVSFVTPLLTKTGKRSTYIIDAFIKDGQFANTWVEIKGYMRSRSRLKWEWFKTHHTNAELWDRTKLLIEGVIT
jgi:hypothetical protein